MGLHWVEPQPLRVLDFDIETRRIGFHSAGKFAPDGCEPVAIAASWADESKVHCWLISEEGPKEMLRRFREMWDQCGLATGHYVRKFDLPILNGAMLEHGLPLLSPKLICDTKGDLTDRAGMSASQENLSRLLAIAESKFHMADNDWRAIARLEPAAMVACRKRVIADVVQHKALREKLLTVNALRAPRTWTP